MNETNGIKTKKQPSFPDRFWMEGLPLGNGITSALILGNVGKEHIYVNRFDRWEGEDCKEIPDVSGEFKKMRELIRQGKYGESNYILSNALAEKGYKPIFPPTPCTPYEITLEFICNEPFYKYERGIRFDTGEAYVSYEQGDAKINRRAFVSMVDDAVIYECSSDKPFSVKISHFDKPNCILTFTGKEIKTREYTLIEDTTRVLLAISFGEAPDEGYDTLLGYHLPYWKKAMGDAHLDLGGGDRSIEALMEDNNDNGISPELIEKLWKFGRYLFVSGTAEDGYPFALYGLWSCEEKPTWAQNVANENVQIIYHHAAAGGLINLVKPLIHYYYAQIPKCREAAKRLFGCRGIFVSVYSTPVSAYPSPNVPVIINYVSSAAWLCRHFYEYYLYTKDEELLENEILPFMKETALFFEDYVIREGGKLEIVPSVSPENTPKNLIPEDKTDKVGFSHPNPAVKNSTMDFAVLKELLTNLIELSQNRPELSEKANLWRKMLSEIPEYRINSDGAIAEWMDDGLEDFYLHRHLSHLYPLFPGNEIPVGAILLPAFERAVELRQLGGYAGWTYPHMSAIYSRLGKGDKAAKMLDGLVKYCMLGNLFTLGYDYREQGSWTSGGQAVVQLDGIMGAVGAIQEMLFRVRGNTLYVLPALPSCMNKGSLKNWHFPDGTVDIEWNKSENKIILTVNGGENYNVVFPEWYK